MTVAQSKDVGSLNFCTYEDRASDVIGLRLLITSLARYEPSARLHVFLRNMPDEFSDWVDAQPNTVLRKDARIAQHGWNIKPEILLHLLDTGFDEMIWIDSDIILTDSISRFFSGEEKVLVLTEEYFYWRNRGSASRTAGWGLPPGRSIPFTLNSSIIRVTPQHRPFLEDWKAMLQRPDYVELQRQPWHMRPAYMMGDQDALAALLGSKAHASVPFRALRQGRDIAQAFRAHGYGLLSRLRNLPRGLPPLVHAQGEKPWRADRAKHSFLETSPYRYAALSHVEDLPPGERDWLRQTDRFARACDAVSFGNANLAGLGPIALHSAALWRSRFSRAIQRLKRG